MNPPFVNGRYIDQWETPINEWLVLAYGRDQFGIAIFMLPRLGHMQVPRNPTTVIYIIRIKSPSLQKLTLQNTQSLYSSNLFTSTTFPETF
jgi:hypothetical protein